MDDRIEERAAALNRYLNPVRNLCQNGELCERVKEVRPLFHFLRTHGRLAEPLPSAPGNLQINSRLSISEEFYEDPVRPLHVAVIDQEDARFGAEWEKLLMARAQARYSQHEHLVVLRMDYRETGRALGLCTLHELYHAWLAHHEKRAGTIIGLSRSQKGAEECRIYLFEGRLLHALNAEAFEQALSNAFSFLDRKLNRQQWKRSPEMIGLPDQAEHLDKILGHIDDPDHRAARNHNFGIVAYLYYAARVVVNPQQQAEVQQQILEQFKCFA